MKGKEPTIEQTLEAIGHRLRDLRLKKYTSYEHFAFANEMNRVTYGRLEKGNDMKVSSLLKALRGLEISPQEFFSEGFDKVISAEEEEL